MACSLLTAGCSTRSITLDSQALDLPERPDGPGEVDQTTRPDAPPPSCDRACPPPTTNTICISGRVFEAVSLLRSAADPTSGSPVPARLVDAVSVGLYDPLALALDPNAKPLASKAVYNDGGCFILPAVNIPLEGAFTLAVDDKASSGADHWVRTAFDVRLAPLGNSAGHAVPVVKNITAAAWGNELLDRGALVLWFRDASGAGVAGVTPTMNGSPPPWSASTCKGDCATFFFGKDCAQLGPGTATTRCGLVAVRAAPWEEFSGLAAGKNVNVAKRGSLAGMLVFRRFSVQ